MIFLIGIKRMLKTWAHLPRALHSGPILHHTRSVFGNAHARSHTHTHTHACTRTFLAHAYLTISYTHSHTHTPATFRHTHAHKVCSLLLIHAPSHALPARSHPHTHSQAHSPICMSHLLDRPCRLLAPTHTPSPCSLSLTTTRV
jgi:hypothetical protein